MDGKLLPVYHGTNNNFGIFNHEDLKVWIEDNIVVILGGVVGDLLYFYIDFTKDMVIKPVQTIQKRR